MSSLDQQFVVHAYLAADQAGYAALWELWDGCVREFALGDPLGRTLPWALPADLPGSEGVLAARGRIGTACQLIVRRHHGVLVASVGLAMADGPGWQVWDRQWTTLAARIRPELLGEDRLYLAGVADGEAASGPEFGWHAGPLLPVAMPVERWWESGVDAGPDLEIWEFAATRDDRATRRFVVGFPASQDAAASALVWSAGDASIAPLVRYLLAAARLRHALRVWQEAPETTDHHRRRVDLTELRQSVEILTDTMRRSLPGPGGPFADDLDLAGWLLGRLGDEIAYRSVDAERGQTAPRPPEPGDDRRRRIFVVHGRDERIRVAVFDLLRAFGLEPLEWERLVEATGSTLPTLADVVTQAIPISQAAVVLMTPDDIVRLHPELAAGSDDPADTEPSMQARPNVLVELGMVLNAYRDRTVMLVAGRHRPISDLAGLNTIGVDEGVAWRRKLADRLRLARCLVDDSGQDWLDPARFAGLTTFQRHVPPTEI